MTSRVCTTAAVTIVLLASAAAMAAETSLPTTFVRGFRGDPQGGFRGAWGTHLGDVPMFGVRQKKDVAEMEWKSAALPAELSGESVTFVWTGATGSGPGGGSFTIFVNGHAAADCDAVLESTQFPPRAKGCRLLYDVLACNGQQSSGHFFLTVPKAWVTAGEAAVLQVKATDAGAETWFALVRAADAPLAIPDHDWTVLTRAASAKAATPPPAGEEASYDWYRRQYFDPVVFTPIGPPSDPTETAVSPTGQLQRAINFNAITGTYYAIDGTAFGLWENGQAVRMGIEGALRQSLEDGYLPIVRSLWHHGDLDIRQRATAEPLRGTSYQSGLESTLAWAEFDITNRGKEARDVTFFAAQTGDNEHPKREMRYRDGVVMENGSALSSARVPPGFSLEFQAEVPATNKPGVKVDRSNPQMFLAVGGLYNALLARGRIEPGQTVRVVVNRVFDAPPAYYWSGVPFKVAAEDLTARSPEHAFATARTTWKSLSAGVSRLTTPDDILNRIAAKAMLDGYFLTKRWNGHYIVFDSGCYPCQWDSCSTNWFYALDMMGDHATAARLLDTVFARQGQRKPAGMRTHEGCFSDVTNIKQDGSAASWSAGNGWALWAMAEHARLANDPAWLTTHKQAILDGCQWIIRERNFSKEKPNNPCRGLLYGKFVCDMPDSGNVKGVGYFAYADAISYLGLHEMAQLLSEWGHPEGAGLLKEAELYRQDIDAAMDRLTDKSTDPWYVPWALHAPKYKDEYLNGVCGPINLAFARVLSRDDPRIAHVIRWNIDHVHHGKPEESATANMFYSQDLAIILLEQGRAEEFLRMFYTILASNVSHQALTTCEWRNNTQPHVHSISSLIHMLRMMMVQERDGGLYLLQGTPRRWLEDGQKIDIRELPTWYGSLSLHCVSHVADGSVRLRLAVPERIGQIPIHLKLRLPTGLRIAGVTINGQPGGQIDGEWLVLSGLKGSVDITAQTAAAAGR